MYMPEKIGPYQIQGLLGKGGMGKVYEGLDPVYSRRVAVKVLDQVYLRSFEFSQRFLQEGRSLAAMNHANVVQIYSVGEFEDRPYLAMEFLDGTDVGKLIKQHGTVAPSAATEIVRQAANGLLESKRVGLVHRDVKPANLVLTEGGNVKVTDFGLAKDLAGDLALTDVRSFVGTPDYLAPEQAMGEGVDSSADVYALGCSLFHMCSGVPPFRKGGDHDHYTAVIRRHLKAERPLLHKKITGFDVPLSNLCAQMMSRKASLRPSLEQLVHELPMLLERLGG